MVDLTVSTAHKGDNVPKCSGPQGRPASMLCPEILHLDGQASYEALFRR